MGVNFQMPFILNSPRQTLECRPVTFVAKIGLFLYQINLPYAPRLRFTFHVGGVRVEAAKRQVCPGLSLQM